MKLALMTIGMVFISTATMAKMSKYEVVEGAIRHVAPQVSETDLPIIVQSIMRNAMEYELDWKIMASIIAQESSFRKDPQACLKHRHHCADLGISQINYHTWGRVLNLNKKLLLTDINYNIQSMARILSILKNSYGREVRWPTRYHSFTHSHRKIYANFIYVKYIKINSYARGYADGVMSREDSANE